jgi:hypothetical protein
MHIMGLNILVLDKDLKEVSEDIWDFYRQEHDREFIEIIEDVVNPPFDDDVFRPKHTNAIRNKINELDWENKERYLQLMDLCDNGHWIYCSY